ncbi:hypothetical protein ACGFNU_06110 [Spirillospora sp. NPDC048911]
MPKRDDDLESIIDMTSRTLALVSALARHEGLDVDAILGGDDDAGG